MYKPILGHLAGISVHAVVALWTVAGLVVAVQPYWRPGDGVPALSIAGRDLGVVCQGQSLKTPSTNAVLYKLWHI